MSRYEWPRSPKGQRGRAAQRRAYGLNRLAGAAPDGARGALLQRRAAAIDTALAAAPLFGAAPTGAADLWLPLGPAGTLRGSGDSDPRVSGRIRDLAVSGDGLRIYAATALGGLWYSPDAGRSWTPVGAFAGTSDRNELAPSSMTLSCGAVHVAFGSVLGEDRKMYRTRSGDSVKLTDLLDEAVERAEAAIAEKNPAITGDERAAVARTVGIGAVKYADLSNDRIKDYVFSFDRMVAFEGNTGPYVQYAHARIRKILRDAGAEAADLGGVVPTVGEPQERALAVALLGLDGAVHDTVDKLGPHRLCTYLFELAQTFTSFYEACPVLKPDVPDELRRSRLALCALTARVLAACLGLLGIEAPDRM